MKRIELYAKVRQMNAQEAIKNYFGNNFTRISNSDLEKFLKGFSTKKETVKRKSTSEGEHKASMITLLSILQAKKVITAKEAEEVATSL